MPKRSDRSVVDTSDNDLGPVAESYDDLQSLPALLSAVRTPPIPTLGSSRQAVRALFQAIEVALVSLEMLTNDLRKHAEDGDWAAFGRTLDWMLSLGKAWADLSWRALDLSPIGDLPGTGLSLRASPNLAALRHAEFELATVLDPLITAAAEPLFPARPFLRYVMLERTGLEYATPTDAAADYAAVVRPEQIRSAVHERHLAGDTVFMQFRAAHQMPEILVDAANDHIELALKRIAGSDYHGAVRVLRRVDRLLDAVVLLADILVDHLDTDDYHQIRENLGLTSGSHSVGIHFHLMRDLVPALVAAADDAGRHDDPSASTVRLLARSIHRHADRWRLSHMNLPRNNLGAAGSGTRSLTGSSDALQVVARMRESAQGRNSRVEDPHAFRATDWQTPLLPLADIEGRLLMNVAALAHERFPDVQQRTGRFAAGPDFRPPPRRNTNDPSGRSGRTGE